jgi:3-phenylpropionate/trans-cinnamate dioxygenase ferredoxin reductase component
VTVVVVGGSLAGVTAADAVRRGGYDGPVTVIGAEPAYARPPLSKGVLTGSESLESVRLPALPSDVTVRAGVAAGLDLTTSRVTLADGEQLPYETLVIATGSRARTIADPGRENVLRTLDDATALRVKVDSARSVLVVGGGFLGMEVASSARALAKSVTVVDIRTPLLTTMGPFLAELFTEAARDHGVHVVIAPGGVRPVFDGDRVAGVDTAEAGRLEADVVVTAVGDEPAVDWLGPSGLPLRGGVVVDEHCRAAENVYAIGDVAVFPTPWGLRRMPHWDTAIGQARAAADALLRGASATPYRPEPYFWTEAFGLAAKLAGHLPVAGRPTVLRGSLADRSVLLHWPDSQRPAAASINVKFPVPKLRKLATAVPA